MAVGWVERSLRSPTMRITNRWASQKRSAQPTSRRDATSLQDHPPPRAKLFFMSSLVTIHVNGAPQSIAHGTAVAVLLTTLPLAGKRFAVERNGEIVPKSALMHTLIEANDRFEIVIAVGGG